MKKLHILFILCDMFIPMYMPPDGHLPKAQNVFQEEQKVEREDRECDRS